MIVKEYYQNINVKRPKDYFEKWYAYVWQKHINAPTAGPGILRSALIEELKKYRATIIDAENGYRFVVTFERDKDYTMFALRWA